MTLTKTENIMNELLQKFIEECDYAPLYMLKDETFTKMIEDEGVSEDEAMNLIMSDPKFKRIGNGWIYVE